MCVLVSCDLIPIRILQLTVFSCLDRFQFDLFLYFTFYNNQFLAKPKMEFKNNYFLLDIFLKILVIVQLFSHFRSLLIGFKFVTFQTWLDLKFSGSSSFKLENLKLIMVKLDLTWTWNFKFGFKFSSFQGPCWTHCPDPDPSSVCFTFAYRL